MSPLAPIDRRAFLASVAAAGGALALGFDIPFGPAAARAPTPRAPEITAWIVIEPDDTVIIRVARSEMGQGSFTALPMLVAEELECDWSKVKAEFVAPEENLRRNRVWGDMSTGGSRVDPHLAGLSAQGRRDRARDADRRGGRASGTLPPPNAGPHNSVITHVPSGRTVTFGAVAEAAARMPAAEGRQAQGSQGLDAARHAHEAARHHRQGPGQADLRHRRARARHAARRGVQSPVFRGKLKSVDESKVAGMQGRPQGRQAGRCRRGGRRQLVAGEEGGRGARPSSGTTAATGRSRAAASRSSCAPGLRPTTPASGARTATSRPAWRRRPSALEAEYEVPFLSHATHGAAELHRPRHRATRSRSGRRRRTARRRSRPPRSAAGVPPRNVIVHKMHARRRLRPARRDAGLRVAGGADRQAGRAAGEGASGRARRTRATTSTGRWPWRG